MVSAAVHTPRQTWSVSVLLAVCGMSFAAPSMAEDVDALASAFGPALTACYESSDLASVEECKGTVADPCMEESVGGFSTLGMVSCMAAETAVWDRHLNEEYRTSLRWAEAMDEADLTNFPEFANRVASLRDAQRAWVVFRDAECGLEYAVWGAGSMRHLAGASCQLEMTAERTITLRSLRDTMR